MKKIFTYVGAYIVATIMAVAGVSFAVFLYCTLKDRTDECLYDDEDDIFED